jgi:hypothetical protein
MDGKLGYYRNLPVKIMIISYSYPPDRAVAARRWGNLVPHLRDLGVECSVIAAGDGIYDEYFGEYGERVIRLPFSNRATISLHAQNRRVSSVKGLWKPAHFYMLPPVIRECITRQWFVYVAYRKLLLEIARESNCIVSSYGPLPPFLVGWILSKNTGRPWIVDIRDSFESRYGHASKWAASLSRILEKILLSQAKRCVAIGEYLASHLSSTYKKEFSAIYNGWVDADVVVKPNRNRFEDPYLYYAGSIYDHQMPALSIVFEAIQKHPSVRLKIRLLNDYTTGLFAQLMDAVYRSEKIEMLPPVEQATVDKELAEAVGALVVEDMAGDDVMRNGTVTGKLIGLMASGIPGLAVSSQHGEIRHLVAKTPGWHGIETVKQCTAALDDLMKPHHVKSNPQYLMDYHMSKQAERLLGLIKNVI